MKTTTKINAFTIAEMLVVLVVTSIIIGLALLTLNLVQKQVYIVQKNLEHNQQVALLERLLWQDFHTYQISYDKNKGELIGINGKDTLIYAFKEDYLLRNQDTLKVAVSDKKMYLDGETIQENELDALEISLTESYQNKNLFIFTQKDASFYLNH